MKVGIVGAGIAGLACADQLARAGCDVQLFDKGRGLGGRMSTRRLQTPLGEASFDHGAQYFTARDSRFQELADQLQAQGLVAPWPAAGGDALVAVPAMNAIVRHMADAHSVRLSVTVKAIEQRSGCWHLNCTDRWEGPFDIVVLAIPAEQAAPILSLHDFTLGRAALREHTRPCWTAMLAFDRPLPIAADILKDGEIVQWAARNNAKPGRDGPESWVVQAAADWSERHCEDDAERVLPALLAAFADEFGVSVPEPVAQTAHRWRFAKAPGTGDAILWNAEKRIGACGDWLIGPRVECAWLSGHLLGESIASARLSQLQPL